MHSMYSAYQIEIASSVTEWARFEFGYLGELHFSDKAINDGQSSYKL